MDQAKQNIQRGGAGNIESPGLKPTNQAGTTGDHDVIPETALRNSSDSRNYHVGVRSRSTENDDFLD